MLTSFCDRGGDTVHYYGSARVKGSSTSELEIQIDDQFHLKIYKKKL